MNTSEVEIVAARYHRDYEDEDTPVEGIKLWYRTPEDTELRSVKVSQDSSQMNNNWHYLCQRAQRPDSLCAKLGSQYVQERPALGLGRDEMLGTHETAVYTEFVEPYPRISL